MAMATPSADKVYGIAHAEIGYTEGSNNFNKYAAEVGVPNNQAWCTTFASWCYLKAGYSSLIKLDDYSVDQYNWFKARGRSSPYPAVGALVWFGTGGENHTGIVFGYDADYIYTIEGNYQNKVGAWKRLRRAVSDASIGAPFAYGYPAYAEGILTADPLHAVPGSVYAATASAILPGTPPPPVVRKSVTTVAGQTYAQVATAADVLLPDLLAWNGVVPAAGTKLWTEAPLPVDPPPPPPVDPPAGVDSWVASVAINDKTGVSYARYTAGDTVENWIKSACAVRGIKSATSVANWVKGYKTAIARESSGDANACNRNDSNNVTPAGYSKVADYGNGYPGGNLNGALTNYQCSRGCAQCIPQTFAANHCPGTSGMIYDPVANIAASMGYVRSQYGVAVDGSNLASKVQQFDPNRPPKGY